MKVEGTDASAVAGQPAKQMKPQKGVAELETTTPDAVELPESEVHGGGVIELLKQGHFKGVADVRLRINFFDELQSLENQWLQDSAEAGFQTFNQSIEEPISLLTESPGFTKEQLGAINQFLENIQEIQHDFLEGDESLAGTLINNLQGEFDTLSLLFTPLTPEAPVESQETDEQPQTSEVTDAEEPAVEDSQSPQPESTEEVSIPESPEEVSGTESTEEIPSPEQTETTPEDSLSDIFTSFQETFQQTMEDLQASLSATQGTQVLPAISEPSGNGKAFEKFIAIYETMKNGDSCESLLINELETVE